MLRELRGLAQAFVRGASAIGRGIEATYTALTTLGLDYVKEQFELDFHTYDQQKAFLELAGELPSEQLIPGVIHGESPQNLTCAFKYDVKAVYENIRGDTVTLSWSVINNQRLTQDEILAAASVFAEDYAPDEYPFHSEPELAGIWVRSGTFI